MSEAEKKAIEAVLHDNQAYYHLALEASDFTDPFYRAAWETMAGMLDRGLRVDIAELHAANEKLSASKLAGFEPVTSANAQFYGDEIKNATQKRALRGLFETQLVHAKNGNDPREIIDATAAALLAISERREVSFHRIRDYLHSVIEEVERRMKSHGEPEGLQTGFTDIDRIIGGLCEGELVIIAARPGIGKTTLALNMAENMALDRRKVGFFSAEMSANALGLRMLSGMAHVPHQSIRSGVLRATDFASIEAAADRIYELDLWIDDTPNIKFAHLRNICRVLKTRGIEIVFIDYLTLVQYGDYRMPRHERVGELTRELKAMARELAIPVVVMSQLGREAEGQSPTLAQLRQSGEVEENADIIMLLHRDRDGETENVAELTIAKHRNGPTGKCELVMLDEQVRFVATTRRSG